MLLLCFSLGDERFALEASKVQEIIPLVRMKTIPKAPEWMAGVMCYHGQTAPVIDLCAMNIERSAEKRLSTRIILVRFTVHDKAEHLLGLMAERVTETLHRQAEDFTPTGVHTPDAPYLGGVSSDREGMLQWVEIDKLLPDKVQDLLFQETSGTGR
jgi:chemotaxis-related protein WspB